MDQAQQAAFEIDVCCRHCKIHGESAKLEDQAQPVPILRCCEIGSSIFQSLHHRVLRKDSAEKIDVGVSGPVPSHTL
jgi:hypothetical protein